MKHIDFPGIFFFVAVAVGLYSCFNGNAKVGVEEEKTKQLELQLKLKGCQQ